MVYLSFIFLALASICNAVIDTLAHHHSVSVFKKYKTGFWADATLVSWKNKYINNDTLQGRKKLFWKINLPVQFTDAWHLFKSLMIIFTVTSIIMYVPLINKIIDFCIIGIVWNLIFNLFYNVILTPTVTSRLTAGIS